MTTKPPPYDPRNGVNELRRVTGLGRDTVRAAIRSGALPGFHVGRQYTVPEAAFIAFCEGRWTPQPRPLFPEPIQPLPRMIHSRKASA